MSDECSDMVKNLHDAVECGDVPEARRLVAAGADVEEAWGEHEEKPLHTAAVMGHVERRPSMCILRFLVRARLH